MIWIILYLLIGLVVAVYQFKVEKTTWKDFQEAPIIMPLLMLAVILLWPLLVLYGYLQSKV